MNRIYLTNGDVKLARTIQKDLQKKLGSDYKVGICTGFYKACNVPIKSPEYYKNLCSVIDREDFGEQALIILEGITEQNINPSLELLFEDYSSYSKRRILPKTKIYYYNPASAEEAIKKLYSFVIEGFLPDVTLPLRLSEIPTNAVVLVKRE